VVELVLVLVVVAHPTGGGASLCLNSPATFFTSVPPNSAQ
jgi:hypothetical protein